MSSLPFYRRALPRLLILLMLCHPLAGICADKKKPAASSPQSATLVVEAESGKVLHQHNAYHLWYPASLTKIMTVYMTFAAVEAGWLKLDDVLVSSAHVAAQPDSRLGLDKGEKISVRDALSAVIAQFANDAAALLAERINGNEVDFAKAMTEKARALGMKHTTFRNANGLPNAEQVTTAHDMAVLAQALIRDFPQHYSFFGDKSFRYKGIEYGNINAILTAYPGADGLKTGFTCGSGYNLVASAKRDGKRLIGVVLGYASGSARTAKMAEILNIGYQGGDYAGGDVLGQHQPGAAEIGKPPFRLSPGECAIGAGQRGKYAGGYLPGWGLLFGVFNDEKKAKAYIAKMQRLLAGTARGKTALVRRQVEDVVSWKALLVGLKQEEAIRACLALVKQDLVCLVQSPAAMNSGKSKTVPLPGKQKKMKRSPIKENVRKGVK